MHRDRERAQTLGARARDLDREAKMLFRAMEIEAETTATTTSAAARGLPERRPGDVGGPTANPVRTTLPAGESTSPARPSNQRLQARPRAPPVGRPTGRSTARRPPVAAVGPKPTPPRAFRNPRASMPPIGKPARDRRFGRGSGCVAGEGRGMGAGCQSLCSQKQIRVVWYWVC